MLDGVFSIVIELVRSIGHRMNNALQTLGFAARLLGKGAVVQRLLGSLQVDIAKNHQLLGWQPPVSLDEGLRRAVQGKL